ncbi:hypothetical protein M758_3G090500 [Ceratodon purpureus]|nr:hypothetical protein M758_3G090500 [Ceratodon purpureus]
MDIRRHNIFLSHSGSQKDFVEQLCEDLERAKQSPFFDKRPHSLPKGEEFAPLIFTAAQECELAVVVLSEEYFTRSKWPMLELVRIVQSPGCLILPLFYRLSCKEFKKPKRRERWFQVWDEWSKSDDRISLDVWKNSLRELEGRNGMEYVKAIGEVSYRKDIVATICGLMQRRSQEEGAAASDEYENDLQQPGFTTATSRLNRRAFACLRSTLLLILRQVVISLSIFLLLVGYDHYNLDPRASPSHDLCHCSHDSDSSIPFHTVNGTDDFPTCEVKDEEEWNFACCYNSAFQRDLIPASASDNMSYSIDPSSVFLEPEGTFHYWTQKHSCNYDSADKLSDVFLNSRSRTYGSEQLSEPLSIYRSFLPRTIACVNSCTPKFLRDS